ncbi:uncharacterized protein LOC121874263 [Homarus americanus]|uniref:uncharacterized protein LOC121874263 n=1 Tax=Homarus americanus TaxID=6706 RepID=UPI001C471710|nr:uncharacterized protein LOC121874263 [Homarus americanus]
MTCPTLGGDGEVVAVVGFHYQVQQGGSQTVLITAMGNIVTFYRVEGHEVEELSSVSVGQAVSHLGYGETFADHDGTIQKKRFLVMFGAGRTIQQFHQITVGKVSPAFAIGIAREWHAQGTGMKVLQSGGRVLITIHQEPHLAVYELKEDFWLRFRIQKIQTLAAPVTSWIMFNTGFENYLLTVSPDKLNIFVQKDAQYEVLQVLLTSTGLKSFDGVLAITLKSCRGEVVLIAGQGTDVVGYVLDPVFPMPQFKVAYRGNLDVGVMDWAKGFAYTDVFDDSTKMVLPTSDGATMYLVRTRLVEVSDPVAVETLDLGQAFNDLKHEYNRQKNIMAAAEDRLYYSVVTNGDVQADITINRGIFVTQIHSTEDLEAAKLVFPGTALAGGVTHQQYLTYIAQLDTPGTILDDLLHHITYIESTLDDAVSSSGTSRIIGGLKTVVGPGLHLPTMLTNSAFVGEVLDITGNPFSLNNTLSSLVIRNYGLKIGGKKTFTKGMVVNELYSLYMDDVAVSDLVSTTGSQTIAGAVFMNNVAMRDIKMHDGSTVAGIDLSKAVLLGESVVLGRAYFPRLEVGGNVEVMSSLLDGVNLDRLFDRSLSSGSQGAGTLEFNSDLVIDYLEATDIMGINIPDLLNDIVHKDEESFMSGKLIVSQSVVNEKNLYAGDVNSKEFPGNYPLKTNVPLVFTDQKNFAKIIIDEVKFGTKGVIGDISPHRFVTKTSNQHITGKKVFTQGIDIVGDLDITTKVIDGVNLDELFAMQGNKTMSADWDFNVIFKKPVRMPGIIYNGQINGIIFTAIAADLVYGNDNPSRISGRKTFHVGLSISNSHFTGSLNGESLESLVTIDTEQEIKGLITFQKDVTFNKLVANSVDGMDLNELISSALYLNKTEQVVSGKKIMNNVLVASLFVKGKVKGVDFKNVVTRSSSQTFIAPQTLHTAVFSSMMTHMIEFSDGFKLNGVDFSELVKKRVPLREAVNHTAVLYVDGEIAVVGTLSAEFINDYKIKELKRSIITDDTDSVIESPVRFSSMNVEGSITTKGKVGGNELSISALAEAAAKLAGNNIFIGNMVFSSVELHGDVEVDGLVDGVDLGLLQHNAVYKHLGEHQAITGTKILENGFTIKGNLITSRTNGVDLSTRLLTLHTDQVITASYSFSDLSAEKNVQLQGLFNKIDLKRLASGALMENEEIRTGKVRFTNGIMVRNLELRKSLNGIDVAENLVDAVRLQDSGVVVTGRKTFMANTRFKSLLVEFLNSVYLDAFFANVVTRNAAHTISGAVTVYGVVSAPWVTVQHLTVHGSIDGIDYKKLKAGAVYLSGEQNINAELVFLHSISVRGNLEAVLLNSYNLAQEYLTTTTEQTIMVNATLGSITATYIDVTGTVNSFYLFREKTNTLLSVGGQTVVGLTTVSGRILVLGNVLVSGRVGRHVTVKLADQTVLLTSDVQISGTMEFISYLQVTSLSSSTQVINYLFIPDLYKNAWFVDRPVSVGARVVFSAHTLLRAGLVSTGPIDELMVDKAYKETIVALSMFQNITEEFKGEFESVCKPIATLYKKLEDCAFEGDFFTDVKDYNFPKQHHSSIIFTAWETTYFIMSYEGQCYSDVFVWEKESGSFVHYQRLDNSGYGHHWLLLKGMDMVFVAMAASSTSNSCSNTNTTIWQVTPYNIEVFQVVAAGEHLSSETLPEGPLLHVHALHITITYTYLADSQTWRQLGRSPVADVGAEVVQEDGSVVYWRSRGGVGHVWVDRIATLTLDLPKAAINYASLFTKDNNIILVLIVTSFTFKEPVYTLRVYYVKERILKCVGIQVLTTSGQLLVFSVGNTATGATFIVVTQKELCPVIYTFSGEILKLWTELSAPRTSWLQHFEVRSDRFPTIMDHYLLLGRSDNRASLYYLVMKGVAIPEKNISCTI